MVVVAADNNTCLVLLLAVAEVVRRSSLAAGILAEGSKSLAGDMRTVGGILLLGRSGRRSSRLNARLRVWWNSKAGRLGGWEGGMPGERRPGKESI